MSLRSWQLGSPVAFGIHVAVQPGATIAMHSFASEGWSRSSGGPSRDDGSTPTRAGWETDLKQAPVRVARVVASSKKKKKKE